MSFVWTRAWGKIITYDNLIKMGFSLVGWCCMCWYIGDTVDQLLLHCDVAYVLWRVFFKLYGAHWVLPSMVADLSCGWRYWFGKNSSEVWNLTLLCLMYSMGGI